MTCLTKRTRDRKSGGGCCRSANDSNRLSALEAVRIDQPDLLDNLRRTGGPALARCRVVGLEELAALDPELAELLRTGGGAVLSWERPE